MFCTIRDVDSSSILDGRGSPGEDERSAMKDVSGGYICPTAGRRAISEMGTSKGS
jgi:hypothetical protein